MLSDTQIERYARQLVLPGWGEDIQEKLLSSSALIIGAGGLGASAIASLACSGVGHLGIMDKDDVELTNLNRQFIHSTHTLGQAKTTSAASFVAALNPDLNLTEYKQYFHPSASSEIISHYDVILDCTDNPASRYELNRACLTYRKPLIFAGAVRMDGQLATILPDNPDSPCLRCLFPEAETDYDQAPSCAQSGIVSPVVAVMGSLQAQEALKLLTGIGDVLSTSLLCYDGMSGQFMTIHTQRAKGCDECIDAKRPAI